MVKNPPANVGDTRDVGLIPGLGRSPSVGNDNPLQYSLLGNPIDRGAWQTTVHGVIESQTHLSDYTAYAFNTVPGTLLINHKKFIIDKYITYNLKQRFLRVFFKKV